MWLSPPSEMISSAFLGYFACRILLKAHIDRVQQRRTPFGKRIEQLALDVLHRACEIADLFGLIGKGNDEKLVLRTGRLEKFADCLTGLLDFAFHAATH